MTQAHRSAIVSPLAGRFRQARKALSSSSRDRVGRVTSGIAVALMSACHSEAPPAPAPPSVVVATPVTQAITQELEFTGNTAATDSVTLLARVEGYLQQVHFRDGERVQKGKLLFTIQQDEYLAELKQAEAQVANEKAALHHAETELRRYQELVKQDSAPQTQVDRWQYKRDAAVAGLIAAEAQVAIAKLNLGYTRITAPFDGKMGRHLVDPGNVVGGVGQPANLAVIDRTDPLYVYFTIDERALLQVLAQRDPASSRPLPDQQIPAFFGLLDEQGTPHEGRLDFASLTVAPTTGTLEVRGIFPNPEPGVLPGLFVRVHVPVGSPRDALLVPGTAVGFDQQGEYVLIVNAAGVVERRPITTGTEAGTSVVVTSGLKPDDQVVIEGLQRAVPGRKVAPAAALATSPAPAA